MDIVTNTDLIAAAIAATNNTPSITDWLMLIITFVYVIATILICIFNYRSAKAAREQTEEMKRQAIEADRPNIIVELTFVKRYFWALRFTNYGRQTANSVVISLDDSFVNSLVDDIVVDFVKQNNGKTITIGVGQSYDIIFGYYDYSRQEHKAPVKGVITYKDNKGKDYHGSFEYDTNGYATPVYLGDEPEELLKKQNEILKNMQQSILFIGKQLHERNERDKNA